MSGIMRVREASPAELGRWDVIVRRFPNHRLPHTRAWIDALGASGCGKPLYLLLEDDTGIAGCFPGLLVNVGGIHLDPVEVRLLAQGLAEQDRGGVSLLAGGRAGAPHANVAGPGDDPGDDVLG